MARRARRRPVSMTSLIDVIFLLLLFFMLSSTFSKFGEVDMQVAQSGGAADPSTPLMFVQLEQERLTLNGLPVTLPALVEQLGRALPDQGADKAHVVLVSVRSDVSAQRMTDLLVGLNASPQARVVLMGDG